MASLQIPDHLEEQLEASAMRRGQSKEELIEEIVSLHLEEEFPTQENFSPEEIARFRNSIAQLDRGEVVTSEQVDAKFDAFFKRLAAR
jgi:predicted transcriptional regulator